MGGFWFKKHYMLLCLCMPFIICVQDQQLQILREQLKQAEEQFKLPNAPGGELKTLVSHAKLCRQNCVDIYIYVYVEMVLSMVR